MFRDALLLADENRYRQFGMIGRIRGLFGTEKRIRWTDSNGIAWLGVQHSGLGFAVSAMGPGWMFDPFLRHRQAEKVADRRQQISAEIVATRYLTDAVDALRLGRRCE